MKIIKFGSDTCGPCKLMATRLKNLNIEVEEIDAQSDDNFDIVNKYKIRNIPTLIMTEDDGTEIKRVSGVVPEKDLKEWVINN